MKNKIRIEGIIPPVPTSFSQSGSVASNVLALNIEMLNRYDLAGYVLLGTNGEYVLLKETEKLHVLETARVAIPKNKLFIAGAGSQSTSETIEFTKKAASIGVDAALIITPFYYKNRMTQDALVDHYNTIADHAPIPVIVYNMPSCTGIDLNDEVIIRLSEHANIIGIKDSGGNVVKMGMIRKYARKDFCVIAGSAGFLLPALSIGANAGILALANIAPQECIDIFNCFEAGDLQKAKEIQLKMIPVNTAVTSNWGIPGLKAAMDHLGLYGGPVRLPLQSLSIEIKTQLNTILIEAGIGKF